MLKIFRNSKGFSLIEVLVAGGVMLIVALGMLTVHRTSVQTIGETNTFYQADAFRQKVMGILSGDAGWTKTYTNVGNTAFACLQSGNCTTQNGTQQGGFAVYDGNGTLVYDGTSATEGFDSTGTRCTTFTAAGNDKCPFHLNLNWTPGCGGLASCANPEVHITGSMNYSPSTSNKVATATFSPKQYAIDLYLGNTSSVSGSGTASYLGRWSAGASVGASTLLYETAGNIGVGTTSPGEKLQVAGNIKTSGQQYAAQYTIAAGATVDFNNGNVQVLQSVGGSAITLNNMKDGGSYVLIVTDTTSRTYTFTNCTNSTFFPNNGATTSGKTTLYNINKVTISAATYCYISWGSAG